jgi:hypothetical protein
MVEVIVDTGDNQKNVDFIVGKPVLKALTEDIRLFKDEWESWYGQHRKLVAGVGLIGVAFLPK